MSTALTPDQVLSVEIRELPAHTKSPTHLKRTLDTLQGPITYGIIGAIVSVVGGGVAFAVIDDGGVFVMMGGVFAFVCGLVAVLQWVMTHTQAARARRLHDVGTPVTGCLASVTLYRRQGTTSAVNRIVFVDPKGRRRVASIDSQRGPLVQLGDSLTLLSSLEGDEVIALTPEHGKYGGRYYSGEVSAPVMQGATKIDVDATQLESLTKVNNIIAVVGLVLLALLGLLRLLSSQ